MAVTSESQLVLSQARGLQGPAGDVSAAQLAAAIEAVKGAVSVANDTLEKIEDNLAFKAPLDGADLTNVTVPTQSAGINSTKAASTAFVKQAVDNSVVGMQPADALLTAISGLSTSMSGFILFTGGIASIVTLDTDGTLAANSDTAVPSQKAVKTAIDAAVVGLIDDRGNYDASGNVFPSAGGSGTAGAIVKGDLWFISVGGTLGGVLVAIGDQVRALADAPGQTAGNWAISEANVGYVPANDALVLKKASNLSDLADVAVARQNLDLEIGVDVVDFSHVGAGGAAHANAVAAGAAGFMIGADKTKLDGVEASADVTDAGNVGSSIDGAAAKATPVDADTVPLIDSAAANVLKKVTWANIKATLKSYFDTLYELAGAIAAHEVVTAPHSATSANTASRLVLRDGSGGFSAGTITGELIGNASTVTTNANLTGPITSIGNVTAIADQSGTGTTFVVDTSPTLVTPNLGTPSAVVLTNATAIPFQVKTVKPGAGPYVPTTNTKYVTVECLGGGGGGGGSNEASTGSVFGAGAGGAGSKSRVTLTVAAASGLTVTLGAAGGGGAAGGNTGAAGGDTSLGTLCIGKGGTGGAGQAGSTSVGGGAGGVAGTGDITGTGMRGQNGGVVLAAAGHAVGGNGGSSELGGGGPGAVGVAPTTSAAGSVATGFGAGGGGAASSGAGGGSVAGGAGTAGLVVITEYIVP